MLTTDLILGILAKNICFKQHQKCIIQCTIKQHKQNQRFRFKKPEWVKLKKDPATASPLCSSVCGQIKDCFWIKAMYALIVKDIESLSTSSNQSDSLGCCVCFHVYLSQSRPWGSMVNPTWSTFTGWTRTTTVSNCRWGSRLSRSRASLYLPTAPTTGEHYRSERYSYCEAQDFKNKTGKAFKSAYLCHVMFCTHSTHPPSKCHENQFSGFV